MVPLRTCSFQIKEYIKLDSVRRLLLRFDLKVGKMFCATALTRI